MSEGTLAAQLHALGVPVEAPSLVLSEGNEVAILSAAAVAAELENDAVLALVLETDGSTYSRPGGMALFGQGVHVGWISGGCLEPEILRRAQHASRDETLQWLEIDTRDDGSLFSGSAIGCRGLQRLVLIPLKLLPGCAGIFRDWCRGRHELSFKVHRDGHLWLRSPDLSKRWVVHSDGPLWSETAKDAWELRISRPPLALVVGAGPEAPPLLSMLSQLGWRISLIESREAWMQAHAPQMDAVHGSVAAAIEADGKPDCALVMSHNFEMDLDGLLALSATDIEFIGLLGPRRRRDDLLRLIPKDTRALLAQRLRSPVGLDLGGRGPEAIALSVAAQLQAYRHSAREDALSLASNRGESPGGPRLARSDLP